MFNEDLRRGIAGYCTVAINDMERVSAITANAYASVPGFRAMIAGLSGDAMVRQNRKNIEHVVHGAKTGEWGPYIATLRERGVAYAKMGMDFTSWSSAFQRMLVELIDLLFERIPDRDELREVVKGTSALFDLMVQVVGETFFEAQSVAMRELSTPILTAGDRVLLVPLVGALDDARLRLLTGKLLERVRAERARAVLLNLAGVATVDSASMAHLGRLTTAVSLMGARVILSGIAPSVCQSLITLGIDVPDADTVATLEEALALAGAVIRK